MQQTVSYTSSRDPRSTLKIIVRDGPPPQDLQTGRLLHSLYNTAVDRAWTQLRHFTLHELAGQIGVSQSRMRLVPPLAASRRLTRLAIDTSHLIFISPLPLKLGPMNN
jgi:hypothetical protein